MGKKVPKIVPSTPTRPRNAFDLSQKHLFTATAGQLLPVMTLDVMPHDHVEIQATDFMRTLPMNSAAFMSMRGVYEFFFVPYSQIYHPFDQLITGMKDYNSSFFNRDNNNDSIFIPTFDIKSYLLYVDEKIANYKKAINSQGHYDSTLLSDEDKDIFGFPKVFASLKLLDLLGYGKYIDMRNLELRVKDIIHNNGNNMRLNPMRLCAYNKIYQDYYMNNTYESRDIKSYNLDTYFQNETEEINAKFIYDISSIKYRNAQLDYFTNLRPSPLFKLPNIEDITGIQAHTGNASLDSGSIYLNDNSNSINIHSASSGITTADIRFGFALEKLLDITQRAGKTYAEQIKAHFGVEVSEGRDGRVTYLGGFDSNIQVGDVTQTSGTTVTGADSIFGGYLGRVTGKAQGSGSGTIKFDAKEHGLIMCIYSIVPDMQYDNYRIDPFNTKTGRGDYFMPEFENLGMQPLQSKHVSDSTFYTQNSVYGWQPRYSEYKTTLDINHGQFCEGEPLSYWTISRNRKGDKLDKFDISTLKISPIWLNSIFAVNFNGIETTDQLFGGCTFNIQKVSDMTEFGMPRI